MTVGAIQEATDRAEILRIITADLDAFLAKDIEGVSENFVQDERMVSMMSVRGIGLLECRGFEALREMIEQAMQKHPLPADCARELDNLRIQVGADMAWAWFDQSIGETDDPSAPPSLSHNFRVFERFGDTWKIIQHFVFEPFSSAVQGSMVEVNPDAEVLWMSDGAKSAVRHSELMTVSAGRLRTRRPAWNATLRSALRKAETLQDYSVIKETFGSSTQRATWPVVLGESETGGLAVCLLTVADRRIFVTFDDAAALDRRLDTAAVLFGLSDAQLRLAREIATGHDLPTAAQAMGITVNTVRTHLRRMFEKTGVNSQPALIRVLLGTAQV